MDRKVGLIGTGVMGSSIIKGLVSSGTVSGDNIYVYDTSKEKMLALKAEYGTNPTLSNEEVVEKSDVIILAVKPNIVKIALETCKSKFDENKILISIVAGVPIKTYKDILGSDRKIIRTMPNTPLQVGEGVTLISRDDKVSDEDVAFAKAIFGCAGMVEELDESLMSDIIALTSSSPAYIFMLIEAMSDAAVQCGIPRVLTYKLASQAVLGASKMVLEMGKHPGELKDQVCTPAGTTIEAISVLEKKGFRHAMIEAMNACTRRAREIGKIYG